MYRHDERIDATADMLERLRRLDHRFDAILRVLADAGVGSDFLVQLEGHILVGPPDARPRLDDAADDIAGAREILVEIIAALQRGELESNVLAAWCHRIVGWLEGLPLDEVVMPSAATKALRRGASLRIELRRVVLPALTEAAPS